jgi:hypothetical protein
MRREQKYLATEEWTKAFVSHSLYDKHNDACVM